MEKNYKRQWRELSDEHKERIRQSSLNKRLSSVHKQHIAQGMKDYWEGVPHKPNEGDITMDELIGADPNKK